MIVGRLLGWLFLLAGLMLLGRDLIGLIDTHSFRPLVVGELWFRLHPGSLELLQPAIQRHLHPALWDDVVQPVLLWWAWPIGLVLGVALIVLCRKRDPYLAARRRR